MLDVLMYHYVRDNECYQYDVFSRSVDEFERQIEYISGICPIIHPLDLDAVSYYLSSTSHRAYLLTFDDGYKDHLRCSQILSGLGFSGLFFPPTAIFSGEILHVNLIHLLLGLRETSHSDLYRDLLEVVSDNMISLVLNGSNVTISEYLAAPLESRYDDPHLVRLKRLLQRDIQNPTDRLSVLHQLFKSLGIAEPRSLLSGLYLTVQDALEMHCNGMAFGGHGVHHEWLTSLSRDDQEIEVSESFYFLEAIGVYDSCHDPKYFCYPYGGYNDSSISVCEGHGVHFAFTVEPGTSSSCFGRPHQLSRWDTNDFWNRKYSKPCLPI